MRNMRKASVRGLLALALCAAGAASALAQARDARVLVARAGVVNLVSGPVEFNREGETAWRALSDKDELKSGDVVKSGAGGRAEVLLNPGSYFRLGESSEFELDDAALDNLRLRLKRGSALVEATGYGDMDLSIVINTPQTRVEIVRSGIYRLNVLPSGLTEVAVWKGRALVGVGGGTVVKGGRVATVGAGGAPALAKLDGKGRDAFDDWSRERGRELAKINGSFARRETRAAFSGLGLFDLRNRFGGIWVSYGGFYTFLPYSAYWRSPYGYGYGSWYYLPYGYGGPRGVVAGGGGRTSPAPGTTGWPHPGPGEGGNTPMPSAAPTRQESITPRNFPGARPSPEFSRPNVGGGEQRMARDQ